MNISNSESRLMELIWANEPINSGKLTVLADAALGWKKSTVYTIIKKLVCKGIIKNENAVVTSLIPRSEILSEKSETLIKKTYDDSLPMFLTAFLSKEKLSKSEAEELKSIIDSYTQE